MPASGRIQKEGGLESGQTQTEPQAAAYLPLAWSVSLKVTAPLYQTAESTERTLRGGRRVGLEVSLDYL